MACLKGDMPFIDFDDSYLTALDLTTCLSFHVCKIGMIKTVVPSSWSTTNESELFLSLGECPGNTGSIRDY